MTTPAASWWKTCWRATPKKASAPSSANVRRNGRGNRVEPRISIVTIAVDDLDRAARFYEAMGLTRHRIRDGVAFFQMGGAILTLFPRTEAEKDAGVPFGDGPSRVYLAYNTRSDAEVDEVLAQAEKSGGRVVKPAGRAFW